MTIVNFQIQFFDLTPIEFAAAARLNKAPSTISYAVGKLEEQLGMLLTGAGEEMLKEGRWLLSAASDLESRMRQIATDYESELRLSDRTVGLLARQPHIAVPSMAAKIACQVAGRATAFCRTAS